MITAVLGALVTLGGYSTNLSNYPRFYDNTVSINVYYDINRAFSSGGNYEVMHFYDRVIYTVDFEKDDNGIHVFFRDCEVRTYYITNWSNTETLIGSSTTYSDDIGNYGTLLLPNSDDYHYLEVTHGNYSLTGTTISFNTYTTWYDETIDSGCSASSINAINVSNTVAVGSFRDNIYRVSLPNIYNLVNNAFGSADGGYLDGYNAGYQAGTTTGYNTGYDTGYATGYTDGVNTDTTVFNIFNGILTIGMIPINVFLAMFDFTILGINISNFVMSLLTVLVTLWIVRTISGSGNENNS